MSWEPLGTTGLREPPAPQICALNLEETDAGDGAADRAGPPLLRPPHLSSVAAKEMPSLLHLLRLAPSDHFYKSGRTTQAVLTACGAAAPCGAWRWVATRTAEPERPRGAEGGGRRAEGGGRRAGSAHMALGGPLSPAQVPQSGAFRRDGPSPRPPCARAGAAGRRGQGGRGRGPLGRCPGAEASCYSAQRCPASRSQPWPNT